MRSSLFALDRHMTSSRQSPKRSALRAGVDLVPLFDERPPGERIELPVPVRWFHFVIVVPSRISRSRSASHQIAKFICPGRPLEICVPLALIKPPREPHIS